MSTPLHDTGARANTHALLTDCARALRCAILARNGHDPRGRPVPLTMAGRWSMVAHGRRHLWRAQLELAGWLHGGDLRDEAEARLDSAHRSLEAAEDADSDMLTRVSLLAHAARQVAWALTILRAGATAGGDPPAAAASAPHRRD
jgi:hypothetical protein